jgi:hypothetical protein
VLPHAAACYVVRAPLSLSTCSGSFVFLLEEAPPPLSLSPPRLSSARPSSQAPRNPPSRSVAARGCARRPPSTGPVPAAPRWSRILRCTRMNPCADTVGATLQPKRPEQPEQPAPSSNLNSPVKQFAVDTIANSFVAAHFAHSDTTSEAELLFGGG